MIYQQDTLFETFNQASYNVTYLKKMQKESVIVPELKVYKEGV